MLYIRASAELLIDRQWCCGLCARGYKWDSSGRIKGAAGGIRIYILYISMAIRAHSARRISVRLWCASSNVLIIYKMQLRWRVLPRVYTAPATSNNKFIKGVCVIFWNCSMMAILQDMFLRKWLPLLTRVSTFYKDEIVRTIYIVYQKYMLYRTRSQRDGEGVLRIYICWEKRAQSSLILRLQPRQILADLSYIFYTIYILVGGFDMLSRRERAKAKSFKPQKPKQSRPVSLGYIIAAQGQAISIVFIIYVRHIHNQLKIIDGHRPRIQSIINPASTSTQRESIL